jgi:pimeloyl-ACP methyl ester carboxylesterase
MSVAFVDVAWDGRPVRIEHAWIATERVAEPLIVFLHEGLGSLAAWKDFPQRLCDAIGCRGLAYSRPGYGRSTPRAPDEVWAPDFMHRQAHAVLPAVLQALGVDASSEPPWLYGHSDGGTIALLYAARFPRALAGAIVAAPHILAEPLSLARIRQARDAYRDTDLRARLARYHDDPDSAFGGWCGAWLDPRFATWSIEDEIAGIPSPLLAIQGLGDEYGTLEQIHGIARRVPGTELLELADCGHSPHRDQPARVIEAVGGFVRRQSRREGAIGAVA